MIDINGIKFPYARDPQDALDQFNSRVVAAGLEPVAMADLERACSMMATPIPCEEPDEAA